MIPDQGPRIDLWKLEQESRKGAAQGGPGPIGFYGTLVQAATASATVEPVSTPIPCHRRSQGRPCPGRLVVRRQDIPAEVTWRCPTCGDGGTIEGWRGSVWDYSIRRPERDPAELVEAVEVLLTEEQWRFLRERMITSGPNVDRMIAARLTDDGVLLTGTQEDLEELAGNVAFEANHTRSPRHRRTCESILDRLDDVLEADRPAPPLDAMQAVLVQAIDTYNRTPQRELGGLSPEQAFQLLGADWETPGGPIEIAFDLSLTELGGVPLLADARLFLEILAEEGGARATSAGNLNRAFVERMFASMDLPADYREMMLRVCKRMNEQEVWPLHVLRLLLGLAGLIQRRKGVFRVTREGARLRADGRAGELYARLFLAHFRRFNLAYLDAWGPETGSLQTTIAYSLFRFAHAGRAWRTREDLVDRLLLPRTKEEIPAGGFIDMRAHIVGVRILQPLESFGLARKKGPKRRNVPSLTSGEPDRYRKTPLYDRFLKFRV